MIRLIRGGVGVALKKHKKKTHCASLLKLFYFTIPFGDVPCQVILEIIEVDESVNGG